MRPEESLCEYKTILVSIRDPEVIPWFRASRSVAVAAIFVEGWGSQLSVFEAVYTTPRPVLSGERAEKSGHECGNIWGPGVLPQIPGHCANASCQR